MADNPDGRSVVKVEDWSGWDVPTSECPACEDPGPLLARLSPTEEYACQNDDCRVAEFYDHSMAWRGVEVADD